MAMISTSVYLWFQNPFFGGCAPAGKFVRIAFRISRMGDIIGRNSNRILEGWSVGSEIFFSFMFGGWEVLVGMVILKKEGILRAGSWLLGNMGKKGGGEY